MTSPNTVNAPSAGGTAFGDEGDNLVQGSLFDDTLNGAGGNDTLTGGAGNDTFQADLLWNGMDYDGFGAEVITDFSDGDVLQLNSFGPGAAVTISLEHVGNDTILTLGAGTSYESTVTLQNYHLHSSFLPQDGTFDGSFSIVGDSYSVATDDYIVGSDGGVDQLYGHAGNDTLVAGESGDLLFGGSGDDSLIGGSGSDLLFGEWGNDTLRGGEGADTYYIDVVPADANGEGSSSGQDVIEGFNDGDVLQLNSFGPSAAVTISLEHVGNDTILTLGAGTSYESTVTLQNYHLHSSFLPQDGTFDGSFSIVGDSYSVATDDYIVGSDGGVDQLYGHAGNDTLVAGESGDLLFGGLGDDSLIGGSGSDLLFGEWGNDTLRGGEGADTYYIDVVPADANGEGTSSGQDVIEGFNDGDVLQLNSFGPGAAVTISLEHVGNDTILTLGAGTSYESTVTLQNYHLHSSFLPQDGTFDGSFSIVGDSYSVATDDYIVGSDGGVDQLYGNAGNDTLVAGESGDLLFGGLGDDSLIGGSGSDLLFGEWGNDTLRGGEGADTYYIDVVPADANGEGTSSGQDVIEGFNDGDVLQLNSFGPGAAVTISLEHVGNDTILTLGAGTSYESTVTLQNYHLHSSFLPQDGTFDGSFSIVGDSYSVATDDYLVGSDGGVDQLYGNAGNDTLVAGESGDLLFGGLGDDSLIGGSGSDLLFGEWGNDTLRGGEGADTYYIDVVPADANGEGTSSGHDVIEGFNDGDVLQLNSFGPDAAVTISLEHVGNDTILTLGAGTSYESTVTLQNYHLHSSFLPQDGTFDGSFSIVGDRYSVATDDYIVGSDGGVDQLYGHAGNDTLVAGESGDLLFGGSGDDSLIGGSGADQLFGDDGNDVITGGSGADHFQFDLYSNGVDTFDFGSDVVTDFEVGDTLEIKGWGLGDLSVSVTQSGADTLLTAEAGTSHESSVLLEDVLVSPGEWDLSGDTFTLWG
ncbi:MULTISPECIES: beta strand repeat-containing protein [Phaeobacter]|nr:MULTISPECIES: calcium-binding protein [Phaeobacter]MDE4125290.1 calcium-binding protein [Phaeobacter gallaeciensis]